MILDGSHLTDHSIKTNVFYTVVRNAADIKRFIEGLRKAASPDDAFLIIGCNLSTHIRGSRLGPQVVADAIDPVPICEYDAKRAAQVVRSETFTLRVERKPSAT